MAGLSYMKKRLFENAIVKEEVWLLIAGKLKTSFGAKCESLRNIANVLKWMSKSVCSLQLLLHM